LKNTSKPRLKKVFVRTTIVIILFYLLVGFSGYLSIGRDANKLDLILQREPLKDSKDIMMKIGTGLFGI